MLYTMHYDSPIGGLLAAEKDGALVGVWLEGQKYFLGAWQEEMEERADSPVLNQTREWLDSYFKGEKPPIGDLSLDPWGSEFRREVWMLLCEIPYGTVTTYGKIARELMARRRFDKMSAQAVGGAVGHNPISIIIPCHRVVGTNGSLTGYAGGLDKKVKLLTLEGVNMEKLFVPAKGTAL